MLVKMMNGANSLKTIKTLSLLQYLGVESLVLLKDNTHIDRININFFTMSMFMKKYCKQFLVIFYIYIKWEWYSRVVVWIYIRLVHFSKVSVGVV